jgi:Tfp pilus assembly protein PilN
MTEQLTADYSGSATEPVAVAPVRVAWAPVPKVNLLPMEIVEGRRFRRTQLILGGTVAATVLVGVAGVLWAQSGISDANDRLTSAQSTVSTLQAQQVKYAAAPKVIAQVEAAEAAQVLAMGADVLWYRYLNDLDGARPEGVELNALTVALNVGGGSAGSGAPGGDPLIPTGIGTITTAGTAERYDQVSSWLLAINKLTGFSASSLTSAAQAVGTANGPGAVTFTSGAVVDSDALSGRYLRKAG